MGSPREFLAGEENALARTARRVVLEHDRTRLPLVICGSTGVGKTLLAEGLADAWREANPNGEVHRTSGSDFARGYANACDTDSIGDFREAALQAGLILVDAVHPLAAKPRAAREFCFQLESWLNAGKLVIVTCLASPLELDDAGLASRLSGGLVLPLALPALDARRELLGHFARGRSLELSDDLIDQLAECVPGSVSPTPSPRDLQGALVQLESTAKLTGTEISPELVASLFQAATSEGVDFKRILTTVAKRFGVGVDELRSSSRRQSLVRARGVIVVLARRLTSESLQSLGKLLGKRDHSTIHHAWQTTEEALAGDDALRLLVESLQQELLGQATATRRSSKAGERG